MIMLQTIVLLSVLKLANAAICTSPNNIYTVQVDLYAGEFGYFKFAECGDEVNPTIGMEIGEKYTFVQNDVSNYYHPLGFGYAPDSHGSHAHGGGSSSGSDHSGHNMDMDMGDNNTDTTGDDHSGHDMGSGTGSSNTTASGNMTSTRQSDMSGMNHSVDAGSGTMDVGSLEHYYSPSGACMETLSCPSPLHNKGNTSLAFIQGEFGIWEEVPDHGLGEYRSSFFQPLDAWLGEWSVELNFDDATFGEDIFYYCHIHNKMAGRIKLLMRGEPVNDQDTPALPEDYYDEISDFDQTCGTHGLAEFQLPNSQCPLTFVCDSEDASASLQSYAECNNAMNCHMFAGMTTAMTASSEIGLFLHHMIPHHQNAVNMGKALLKSGAIQCEGCVMESLVRSLINRQNHEIQIMQNILEQLELPMADDCVVEINSEFSDGSDGPGTGDEPDNMSSSVQGIKAMASLLITFVMAINL